MEKYIEYREKLYNQLNALRQPNGTFRASSSEHYNATWIRDNYWNAQPYLPKYPGLYLQTCHTHLDFLKMYENEYDHKISWLVKDNDIYGDKEHRFIHPKVNFDGTEIEGLQWRFIQVDTLFYYILLLYNGFKAKLPVFRDAEDYKVVQLLIKAIENLDIDYKPLSHSWEENIDIFTSNLGLGIKAMCAAYEMGFDVDRSYVKRMKLKFYQQFPHETVDRDWDLTLLFLCVLDDFLSPLEVEDIVKGITFNLEREYGVIRYKNDVYLPFDVPHDNSEMQWIMGFGYLALSYLKCGNIEVATQYIEKVMNTYPNGVIPEGVDKNGTHCYNTPLMWSVSMIIQAINKLEEVV